MPKVDYDAEYAKQIKINQTRMIEEINAGSREIREKIQSRLAMQGLSDSVDDVLKELQAKVNSKMTAADIISISEWAAVKPERQSLHEKVALLALQRVYGLKIRKLPTRGKRVVYFSSGKIVSKKPDTDSKSIDFLLNMRISAKQNGPFSWDTNSLKTSVESKPNKMLNQTGI